MSAHGLKTDVKFKIKTQLIGGDRTENPNVGKRLKLTYSLRSLKPSLQSIHVYL